MLENANQPQLQIELQTLGYAEAVSLRNELHWRELAQITVQQALQIWISTIDNFNTRNAYTQAMAKILELELLDLSWNLQALALINGDAILDKVKALKDYSEATKQARAAALLSFFRFLQRRTQGLIKRIVPSREGTTKTFFKIRDKVDTQAMTQAQWTLWLEQLRQLNQREWLIARIALQGGKRIGEVLSLKSDQIDMANRRIRFIQSKTKGTIQETVITYPPSVMQDLTIYLGSREGLVFITRGGKQVSRHNVYNSFVLAGERAKIPFPTTPHTLRASCITYLLTQGFPDSGIMRVSGHASAEMIKAYDKRSSEDNPSAHVSLTQ